LCLNLTGSHCLTRHLLPSPFRCARSPPLPPLLLPRRHPITNALWLPSPGAYWSKETRSYSDKGGSIRAGTFPESLQLPVLSQSIPGFRVLRVEFPAQPAPNLTRVAGFRDSMSTCTVSSWSDPPCRGASHADTAVYLYFITSILLWKKCFVLRLNRICPLLC
jgi:hypothetical protein